VREAAKHSDTVRGLLAEYTNLEQQPQPVTYPTQPAAYTTGPPPTAMLCHNVWCVIRFWRRRSRRPWCVVNPPLIMDQGPVMARAQIVGHPWRVEVAV